VACRAGDLRRRDERGRPQRFGDDVAERRRRRRRTAGVGRRLDVAQVASDVVGGDRVLGTGRARDRSAGGAGAVAALPDLRQRGDRLKAAGRVPRGGARLNGVAAKIEFRVASVDETTASVDLVCANLTADVISSILPQLRDATCGRLVLSGILDVQLDVVRARLHECGMPEPIEIMRDGEWIAIIV